MFGVLLALAGFGLHGYVACEAEIGGICLLPSRPYETSGIVVMVFGGILLVLGVVILALGESGIAGQQHRYCTNCGQAAVNQARFCANCGAEFHS